MTCVHDPVHRPVELVHLLRAHLDIGLLGLKTQRLLFESSCNVIVSIHQQIPQIVVAMGLPKLGNDELALLVFLSSINFEHVVWVQEIGLQLALFVVFLDDTLQVLQEFNIVIVLELLGLQDIVMRHCYSSVKVHAELGNV